MFKRPKDPQEFYIGYLPKAGAEYRKFIWLVIGALIVLAYVLASFIVTNQRGFSAGTFDRKDMSTLQGVLVQQPFPAIRTFYGKDINGNAVVKTIPLVSSGKFGADPVLDSFASKNKGGLNNYWVTLQGHLIYNHGIAILELTDRDKSITNRRLIMMGNNLVTKPLIRTIDSVTLQGQIIDPKCYFGVMKPGEGKPHSDCAIRCISGGIMPMLKITDDKGQETYFVIRGKDGKPINDQIIPYVGIPVSIQGSVDKVDDWMVLKVDPENGIKAIR